MEKRNGLQELSLPSPDEAATTPQRAQMPWERRTIYTVETPDGELMGMGPEELERYAAGAKKTEP